MLLVRTAILQVGWLGYPRVWCAQGLLRKAPRIEDVLLVRTAILQMRSAHPIISMGTERMHRLNTANTRSAGGVCMRACTGTLATSYGNVDKHAEWTEGSRHSLYAGQSLACWEAYRQHLACTAYDCTHQRTACDRM